MSYINSLVDDLGRLGIAKGDVVLVRASLKKIGIPGERIGETLVNTLLNAVGDEGTIVGLTFTRNFFLPRIDKKYIFNAQTPSTSGGFTGAMLAHPKAVRSMHPTNSYVAIGRDAHAILDHQDESSTCFSPIEKIVDMDGKMILIGCVFNSPGFTTVHLAQEKLGLSSRSILKGLIGVYYQKDSQIKLFKKRDFGGCSDGFYKLYSHYVRNEKLICGEIGNAYSIGIKAKDAYTIDYNVIKNDNKYPLCDNPRCFSCRGTWWYNKSDMVKYYLINMVGVIKRFRYQS